MCSALGLVWLARNHPACHQPQVPSSPSLPSTLYPGRSPTPFSRVRTGESPAPPQPALSSRGCHIHQHPGFVNQSLGFAWNHPSSILITNHLTHRCLPYHINLSTQPDLPSHSGQGQEALRASSVLSICLHSTEDIPNSRQIIHTFSLLPPSALSKSASELTKEVHVPRYYTTTNI